MEREIPSIVKFSCRGKSVSTLWTTLYGKGENMLTAMVRNHYKGSIPSIVDASNGGLFLDKEARVFHAVLNVLAGDGCDVEIAKEFAKELQYFQIDAPVPTSVASGDVYAETRRRFLAAADKGGGATGAAKKFLEKYGGAILQAVYKAASEGATNVKLQRFRGFVSHDWEYEYKVHSTVLFSIPADNDLNNGLTTELSQLISVNYGFHCGPPSYSGSDTTISIDWSKDDPAHGPVDAGSKILALLESTIGSSQYGQALFKTHNYGI